MSADHDFKPSAWRQQIEKGLQELSDWDNAMKRYSSFDSRVVITPFKVEMGDMTYPISGLTEMFKAFGPSWEHVIVLQSASVVQEMKNTNQKLLNVSALNLMDLRITRNELDNLVEIVPKMKRILFGNVHAASDNDCFDIVLPRLKHVIVVAISKRLWFDIIFANKATVREITFLFETEEVSQVTTVALDETTKMGFADMAKLTKITLPAKLFVINDLCDILRRSKSLKTVSIGELNRKQVGEWCRLLPEQWRFCHVAVEDEYRNGGDDGGNRQNAFYCTLVRCSGT